MTFDDFTSIIRDIVNATERLTEDRTYYVRTDGSDLNLGLTNTAAGAFKTLQKAVDAAYDLDCGGYKVTIQVASGTYTAGVKIIGRLRNAYDTNRRPFQIIGDIVTPANVAIVIPSANAIELFDAYLYLDGVSISTCALRPPCSGVARSHRVSRPGWCPARCPCAKQPKPKGFTRSLRRRASSGAAQAAPCAWP